MVMTSAQTLYWSQIKHKTNTQNTITFWKIPL